MTILEQLNWTIKWNIVSSPALFKLFFRMIKIICCLLLLNFVQKGICMGSGQDLILALDYRLIESLSNLGTLVLSQYFNHTRCLIFLSEGESGRLILNEMKVKLSGYYFHVFFPTAETSDMVNINHINL